MRGTNQRTRDHDSSGNGWTGGQYSVFRILLGGYLIAHYAMLLPWAAELFSSAGMLPDGGASPLLHAFPNVLALTNAPWLATVLVATATALAGLLAAGRWDRGAALGLWYIGACLLGRNPLIANPAMPFVGWMLLAHACLPRAPFGSWAARGRSDPDGGWRLPDALFAAAWVVMAVGYSYSGFTKLASPSWLDGSALAQVLANPLARDTALRVWLLSLPPVFLQLASWGVLALELAFAPLALSRRVRPWLWLSMLLAHLGLVVLIDFADLSLAMALLHVFTFDPAWLPPLQARSRETVLFDGDCSLCHGFVRFLLAEDALAALRFAPLGHPGFRSEEARIATKGGPHSLLVVRKDGAPLVRSDAVLHLLARLGGMWRATAAVGRLIPLRLRDALYDLVASQRRQLAPPPDAVCPLVPARLMERFVL